MNEHYTDNQQIEELLPPEEYTVISGKTDEELAQLLGVEVADLLAILWIRLFNHTLEPCWPLSTRKSSGGEYISASALLPMDEPASISKLISGVSHRLRSTKHWGCPWKHGRPSPCSWRTWQRVASSAYEYRQGLKQVCYRRVLPLRKRERIARWIMGSWHDGGGNTPLFMLCLQQFKPTPWLSSNSIRTTHTSDTPSPSHQPLTVACWWSPTRSTWTCQRKTLGLSGVRMPRKVGSDSVDFL